MIELRSYQARAVADAQEAFARKRNGIVVIPTGGGKSLVIAGVANAMDRPVVVLQPTKEILEQNFRKIQEFGQNDVAMWSASVGKKQRARVTFATIGSIKDSATFSDVGAVIIDECHLVNAKGGQYVEFIASLGVPVVGLTATPYRMSSYFGGEVVEAKFLHRTRPRAFHEIAHITQGPDLHHDGFLAPVNYVEGDGYRPGEIKRNSTGLGFEEKSLASYNEKTGIVRKASDTVIANHDKHAHFLVFVEFIHESKAVLEALRKAGVRAEHIDGQMPKGERARILNAFRAGELKAVVNVGVLTTGFDFPALDCVVMARPTMSVALHYQMIGRCVRTAAGKRVATVRDLCGNVERYGRPSEWRIIEPKKGLHEIVTDKVRITGVNLVTGSATRDLAGDVGGRKAAVHTRTANRAVYPQIIDEATLVPFGKHAGTKISDLPEEYLRWAAENFNDGKWKSSFREEVARREGAAHGRL